jgi:hypothetical protein
MVTMKIILILMKVAMMIICLKVEQRKRRSSAWRHFNIVECTHKSTQGIQTFCEMLSRLQGFVGMWEKIKISQFD